jgi:hypothetical protein
MDWIDAATKAVLEGTTGCQVAIPDGKFPGDLYFITTTKNEIIKILMWDENNKWIGEEKLQGRPMERKAAPLPKITTR